jgi:hypothetical protein
MVKMLLLLIALTLAMSPRELQRDVNAPLHSAVTDTPCIVDMTFADPLTWGDGLPGLESDTVVRTSSADFACRGMFCVSR